MDTFIFETEKGFNIARKTMIAWGYDHEAQEDCLSIVVDGYITFSQRIMMEYLQTTEQFLYGERA